jgi:hypothetical protein
MGNWRTVEIVGRVSPEQAVNMIEWLKEDDADWKNIDWDNYEEHPIEYLRMNRSLCGINQWVNEDGTITCQGNLSSKSPSDEDVERELNLLVEKYDTLELKLHLGGDYESDTCVATFTAKDGTVTKGDPEKETVSGASIDDMNSRMFGFLTGR